MTSSAATTDREGSGGRVVLLLLLGLVLLAGGAYGAAYYAAGEKVPRGTTVAGVDIGGQEPDEAADVLRAGLADRELAPLRVSAGEASEELRPAQIGLSVDHEASVADAGGERSLNPRRIWEYFTGGSERQAVLEVDQARLDAVLERLEERAGTPPVDAAVEFAEGAVEVTEPRSGESIDRAAARESIEGAYLSDDPHARLALVETAPEVGQEALDTALDDFANPAVSGPVSLMFGTSEVRLNPRQFSAVLAMDAEGGALVPSVRPRQLRALVDEFVSEEDRPVDATFRIVDGKPRVVRSKPGVSFETEAITETFLDLVTRPAGERSAEVEATVAEPEFTTRDARALGVKEQVSTFTTSYPHAEYRNINIGRAAEIVNGTLLKPGDVFSLNEIVGERTAENGFTKGFIIANGIFREDFGGGVSQMATTTFNAMFFAGLKDIEHKPHSFYIDRYPVGREATVAWGAIDLRFENDTEHGVYIESFINRSAPGRTGSVTVNMYSTKTWDITTSTSNRYAFTSPSTRVLTTPDCFPNPGHGGFKVDVTRNFLRPGSSEVVRSEVFNTTYTPSDRVECRRPGQGDQSDDG